MIAGTLGRLDPVEEKLASWCRNNGFPALDVALTQDTLDDQTPQRGKAATQLRDTHQMVDLDPEDVSISTGREEGLTTFVTDWYADVTGSGVVLAESIADTDDPLAFPFDLISTQAGSEVQRLAVNIPELKAAWSDAGVLTEVWMTGQSDGLQAQLNYHDAADSDDDTTIGLGFKRGWNGTIIRGVVYQAGYVALYNASTTSEGIQFAADELLPYTFDWDEDEFVEQTDFDEFGNGGGS